VDAESRTVVPPEEAVPPNVVLQNFMDDSRGLRSWLGSLGAALRRLLGRG
jgi:hypothetical protein